MPASSPYPPVIVRWARDTSRRGLLASPPSDTECLTGTAHNRTCGDRVSIHIWRNPSDRIALARFDGEGCALCLAAAAALCEIIEGCNTVETKAHLAALRQALDIEIDPASIGPDHAPREGLDAFVAVRPFPARHRCVTLPADAIAAALASPPVPPTI